jgi:hypothetical protein
MLPPSYRPTVEALEDRQLLTTGMTNPMMPTMNSMMPSMMMPMMPMPMPPPPDPAVIQGTLDLAVAVGDLAVRLDNPHLSGRRLARLIQTEQQLQVAVGFVLHNVPPNGAQLQNALNLLQQANSVLVQEATALAAGMQPSAALKMEAQTLEMQIQNADMMP